MTSALAKNGFSGLAIQSTSACRGSSSAENFAYSPSRYFGSGVLPVSGFFSPVVGVGGREVRRRLAEALAAEPREEAGQAVVVVLAPALVRMMVAAGALQPQAEEHLGHVGRHLMQLVVAVLPVPVDRRRVLPFAGRRDDAADELVVRAGCGRSMSLIQLWNAYAAWFAPGEVASSAGSLPHRMREVRRVVGRVEQPVDQLRPLVGDVSARNARDLVARRQPAAEVERHAAEELASSHDGDGSRPSFFHFSTASRST